MKRSLVAAAIAAGVLFTGPAAAMAQAPHYKVDAHDETPWRSGGFDYAGSVRTDAPLTEGVWYIAEVQGTVSYYDAGTWKKPSNPWKDICGQPLNSKTAGANRYHASPGVDSDDQGYVGMDAETVFARPCYSRDGAMWPKLGRWTNFEINDGSGYRDFDPTEGTAYAPSWSNAYDYALQGKGVPAKFRFRDMVGATKDNYGRLDVYLRPAGSNDCWVGDPNKKVWEAFGFDSYESCWHGLKTNADADTYTAAATAAKSAKSKKAANRR